MEAITEMQLPAPFKVNFMIFLVSDDLVSDYLHTVGKGFLVLEEIYFTSFFLVLKQNILNSIP